MSISYPSLFLLSVIILQGNVTLWERKQSLSFPYCLWDAPAVAASLCSAWQWGWFHMDKTWMHPPSRLRIYVAAQSSSRTSEAKPCCWCGSGVSSPQLCSIKLCVPLPPLDKYVNCCMNLLWRSNFITWHWQWQVELRYTDTILSMMRHSHSRRRHLTLRWKAKNCS